jgi:hypothetical protein
MPGYESIPVGEDLTEEEVIAFEKTLKTIASYKAIAFNDNDAKRFMRATSNCIRWFIGMMPLNLEYERFKEHFILGLDEVRNRAVVMRITNPDYVHNFTEIRDATKLDMMSYPIVDEWYNTIE